MTVSEYLQENRRAVVMLIVAVGIALLGGLYLLLSGGGEQTDLGPVPKGKPSPSATMETEEPTDPLLATNVGRGTNANPFGPLTGSEEDVSDVESDTPEPTKQTSPKKTSSYGTTNTNPATRSPSPRRTSFPSRSTTARTLRTASRWPWSR